MMYVPHKIPCLKGCYHVTFLKIQNAPWIIFSHMLISKAAKKNMFKKFPKDIEGCGSLFDRIFASIFPDYLSDLQGLLILHSTTSSYHSLVQKWKIRIK